MNDEFSELAALTQLHLLQEFSWRDWKNADPQTFSYFKHYAQQLRANAATPSNSPPANAVMTPQQPSKSVVEMPPPQPMKHVPAASPPPPQKSINPSSLPKTSGPKEPPKTVSPKAESQSVFELQPLPPSNPLDFSDLKKLMQSHFPSHPIIEQVPSDDEAKKINNAWQQPSGFLAAVIVAGDSVAAHYDLLSNIANAIQTRFVPAQVISHSKLHQEADCDALVRSPSLRVIVISSPTLLSLPHLMKHYRDEPQSGKKFLGTTPLCLMADPAECLKNPQLKVTLWNTLKQILSHGA